MKTGGTRVTGCTVQYVSQRRGLWVSYSGRTRTHGGRLAVKMSRFFDPKEAGHGLDTVDTGRCVRA